MQELFETYPPVGNWSAGLKIRVSAWTTPHAEAEEILFRTLSSPGDLAPDLPDTSWNLTFLHGDTGSRAACRQLANGFLLTFGDGASAGRAWAIYTAPGVLLGEVSGDLRPALFSPELEIHESENQTWVEHPALTGLLLIKPVRQGFRFCLCSGTAPLQDLVHRARAELEAEAFDHLEQELHIRLRALERLDVAETETEPCREALEELIGCLRRPTGACAGRWSATRLKTGDLFQLNHLQGLVATWLLIDPDIAADLLRTAFLTQAEDGSLPQWIDPASGQRAATAPWPVLAGLTAEIREAGQENAWLDQILPRLDRYLTWAGHYFDQAREGVHTWQDPDEAVVPDVFDDRLVTGDLHGMLLEECRQFNALMQARPLPPQSRSFDSSALQEAVEHNLNEVLWDQASESFRDRYIGGDFITRITLPSVLPLWWDNLGGTRSAACLTSFFSRDGLADKNGIRSWQSWSGDETEPPVELPVQHVALSLLLRHADPRQTLGCCQAWLKSLQQARLQEGYWPDSLSGLPDEQDSEDAIQPGQPVLAAALYLRAAREKALITAGKEQSRLLKWMDRHRVVSIGVPSIALVSLILVVVITFLLKERPPQEDVVTYTGWARTSYQFEDYQEAIDVLEDLSERGVTDEQTVLIRGNAHFRRGELGKAEALYREGIEKHESPRAHINLVLALLEQGKAGEAREALEEITEKHRETAPYFSQRAAFIMELLDQQDGG